MDDGMGFAQDGIARFSDTRQGVNMCKISLGKIRLLYGIGFDKLEQLAIKLSAKVHNKVEPEFNDKPYTNFIFKEICKRLSYKGEKIKCINTIEHLKNSNIAIMLYPRNGLFYYAVCSKLFDILIYDGYNESFDKIYQIPFYKDKFSIFQRMDFFRKNSPQIYIKYSLVDTCYIEQKLIFSERKKNGYLPDRNIFDKININNLSWNFLINPEYDISTTIIDNSILEQWIKIKQDSIGRKKPC